MKRLLVFGSFAHDPQRVLAAVHRFTDVTSELLANFLYRVAGKMAIRLELAIAAFAYAEGRSSIISHDPQFALCHEYSLAPNACANETAPVPQGPFDPACFSDEGIIGCLGKFRR
jgi:hypothetical protein